MRDKIAVSRFSDAPWMQSRTHTFTVGGAGGISSWLLLFLSRIDIHQRIYLYEFDTVDETNLAGQIFHRGQVGMLKSEAIKAVMNMFSDNSSNIDVLGRYHPGDPVSDIVICGFDNMKARKDMFEQWKKSPTKEIFIDGRMIMEDGQIYAVTPGKEERYEATLFDDSELADARCSMKATTHSGAHIASVMIAILTNYISNRCYYKDYVRDVPFSYTFSFVPMLFEVNV